MSIFDCRFTEPTHMRRFDSILPMQVCIDSKATGEIKPYSLDANEEWIVSLTLKQNYWANTVQRAYAERTAVEALAYQLYEDIHVLIPRLKLAIVSGSKHDALEIIVQMEKAMRP